MNPYRRLARNKPFRAFWLAQTISPLGDRIHQVALAVLVYGVSHSAPLTALVFLASSLPRLVVGPLAGVYADRVDRRWLMIRADVLRAGLVPLVPLAAAIHPVATLPITFLVSSVGLFFEPARGAILPSIVESDELMAAVSAANMADTLADLAGYPIAGLLTVLLAPVLWVAFVLDAGSYLVSALLLRALPSIPPPEKAERSVRREFMDGLWFLRHDSVLWHNTLLSAAAQVSAAVTTALLVVYAASALTDRLLPYQSTYTALLLLAGVGNLLGAYALGLVGGRIGRGRLILVGYAVGGGGFILLAVITSTPVALVLMVILGAFNMLWLVPLKTLFMERVPSPLLGRVIAARGAIVWGAMVASIALVSVITTVVPVALTFGLAGALTLLAALAAAASTSVRRPEDVPLHPERPGAPAAALAGIEGRG